MAVYPGRDPKAKAILLLAHIDVVEAKREDWTRDPFTLVEENGYFYARGAMRRQGRGGHLGRHPDPLPPGEASTPAAHHQDGADLRRGDRRARSTARSGWSQNQRDLIDAAFALNEGAGGELDDAGQAASLLQRPGRREDLAELPAGGDQPRRPQLAPGARTTPSTTWPARSRAFRATSSRRSSTTPTAPTSRAWPRSGGQGRTAVATAMTALVKDPNDARADRARLGQGPELERDAAHHLRRHHARRRATPPTPCRSGPAPTSTAASSRACRQRERARASSRSWSPIRRSRSTTLETRGPSSPPPPLTPAVMGPIEKLAAEFWPGVPVVPILQAGATDGQFLNAAGIPDLRHRGHLHRPGPGQHPRAQRVHRREVAARGPRLPLPAGQDLRRPALIRT